MSSETFASLGGTEISNAARFQAYTRNLGILHGLQGCPCPDLAVLLDDDPYDTPLADLAPWYDSAVSESSGFAGVWIEEITGISASTITREYTRNLNIGATAGPIFDAERVMSFSAWIAADSESALSYGLAWLASALRAGGDCAPGQCIGDEFCFLAACPIGPIVPDDAELVWRNASRYLYDVALVSGPEMVEKHALGTGCGGTQLMLAKVQWTMTAGMPGIFSFPFQLAIDGSFTPPVLAGEDECDVVWIPAGQCPPPVVCNSPGCVNDPSCVFEVPPDAPQDSGPCSCVNRVTSATHLTAAGALTTPRWFDQVPLVQVSTGSADMRRLSIRFFSNADGLCSHLDDCKACGELNLVFAPRDSVVTFDGRTQRVTITCPGGLVESAERFLYGPNGQPPDWPVFTCNQDLCVQVLVDGDFYATDARVDIALVSRQDAV